MNDPDGPNHRGAEAGPEPPKRLALTRELLLDGALQRMVAQTAPLMPLMTDEARARSLRDTLARRPDRGSGAWLFAYGSLIWNPTFRYDERRIARVEGWHRAFCLSTPAGRGTFDNPGLLLGLDRGGDCAGEAFHVAEDVLEEELTVLWRREMLSGSYIPDWVDLRDPDGNIFARGIAFTIDPACTNYAGMLPEDEKIRRLATAAGMLGSSAEYLFRTRDGLRALGIRDADLERMAERVEQFRTTT
jgi:cation transport protein ChaC